MIDFVRFDNYFPFSASKAGVYDKSAVNEIRPIANSLLKHLPQLSLVEATRFHSLFYVGSKFELPCPPVWPPHPRTISPDSTLAYPYWITLSRGSKVNSEPHHEPGSELLPKPTQCPPCGSRRPWLPGYRALPLTSRRPHIEAGLIRESWRHP